MKFSRAKVLTGKLRVLSFYLLTDLADPAEDAELHKKWCKSYGLTGRVWISRKGINAHVCGPPGACRAYAELAAHRLVPPGKRLMCKLEGATERVVETLRVKEKELVTLAQEQNEAFGFQRGRDLDPEEWADRLEELSQRRTGRLLDIRSGYEWDLGHFGGAERPKCEAFSEMNLETLGLADAKRDEPVMMYCTGGIRCEFVAAMLRREGFEDVCKLRGGVQHYGNTMGSRHWNGRLFVFDRRDSIAVGDDEAPVVGKCYLCGEPCEDVWNCHNYQCNRTMLACQDCMQAMQGCCCTQCREAEPRPYEGDRRKGRGPGTYLPEAGAPSTS